MVARVKTVAFQGIDVFDVDVQVQIASGLPAFQIVGLPDKAVAESRERVRSALHAIGLSLPPKRLTVNLSPADVLKEGSHFDLPIALGVLAAMEVFPADELDHVMAMGELALDGTLTPVSGILPAAVHAAAMGRGIICPQDCGKEAAWAGADIEILAPHNLIALMNHVKGVQVLPEPEPVLEQEPDTVYALDMKDVRGQETAKRALEVAAAGGHNVLMSGPPGSGKSMLAARIPGLLPPLTPEEALDVSMVHSIAGALKDGALKRTRPFRDPHHSASQPSMVGGGHKAKPGEISLAHNGILFLDELPEFSRTTLEALRQPLETGEVLVSRVNYHVTFPARFQLIAAMNPCRCGHLNDAELACNKAPKCGQDYQNKLSGPLLDRIDLYVDVPAVNIRDLTSTTPAESSADIAARVLAARVFFKQRLASLNIDAPHLRCNADLNGEALEQTAALDEKGRALLTDIAERLKLSARGYYRILRVARSLADLEQSPSVLSKHIAEAANYRQHRPGQSLAA